MPNARYLTIQRAAQTQKVRRALDVLRDQKIAQLNRIAQAEDIRVNVTASAGTRPKGRPYSRITIPARVEHGDYQTPRTRLLGRIVR